MPALSHQFLQDLGITLDEQHYQALADHFETTLEDRVINEILNDLDESQLRELASLRGQGDDKMQAWLQANVPELGGIVRAEVDILLGELAENSDKI